MWYCEKMFLLLLLTVVDLLQRVDHVVHAAADAAPAQETDSLHIRYNNVFFREPPHMKGRPSTSFVRVSSICSFRPFVIKTKKWPSWSKLRITFKKNKWNILQVSASLSIFIASFTYESIGASKPAFFSLFILYWSFLVKVCSRVIHFIILLFQVKSDDGRAYQLATTGQSFSYTSPGSSQHDVFKRQPQLSPCPQMSVKPTSMCVNATNTCSVSGMGWQYRKL